jgi:glutamine amidotransferase
VSASPSLVVVDYETGNVGSIPNMLRRLGVEAVVSSEPDVVAAADRLILPGVGAFDHGMAKLEALGLQEALDRAVRQRGVPITGMCLGMQLMTQRSDEGERAGLGWVEAETVHFSSGLTGGDGAIRLPHIGWNYAYALHDHPLLADLPDPASFYFVHTYRVVCRYPDDLLLGSRYSGINFCSGFARDNVSAVQFHPEKSHHFGLELLRRFVEWNP